MWPCRAGPIHPPDATGGRTVGGPELDRYRAQRSFILGTRVHARDICDVAGRAFEIPLRNSMAETTVYPPLFDFDLLFDYLLLRLSRNICQCKGIVCAKEIYINVSFAVEREKAALGMLN